MKYRNKYTGEVLEAFQYDGDMQNSDGEYYVPEWAVEALKTDKLYYANMDAGGMPPLCLKTEEEDDFMIPVGFYVVKKADGTIDAFWEEFFEFVYQPMTKEQRAMNEILFRTIRSCCGVGVYLILSMCWKMVEVKLYGFSQESIIDSFAAVGLAIGATEWMFSFVVREDDEE